MKGSSVATNGMANRAGWKHYISRLQGSTVCFDLSGYAMSIAAIADLENEVRELSDQEIQRRSQALRVRARSREQLSALRTSLFALAREASRRVLGERPFDEQVVAALALDAGHVVEMQTGEGKTRGQGRERAAEQRAPLVAAAGEEAVLAAERTVTLDCIDRAWQEHLARCADLREGIHLVRLGGQDPLTVFTSEAIRQFSRIDDTIEEAVLAALAKVRIAGSRLDLTQTGIKAPSATWTYLVNDDPFKSRLGAMLTGPGGVTIGIYSAVMMMPLLIVWGLIEKLLRRGERRRSDPFGS